ncbi:protein of unknown function [Legionella fallonii LLAP-10]|uniref:Uncharacterized protein n=1 Tax=Legionella fallonii LLAP-10 TaxID=1212491 RepID=A0A098G3X7_9GAMM|nr:protein of unknown function [Legionella fallonii LLAP-10]
MVAISKHPSRQKSCVYALRRRKKNASSAPTGWRDAWTLISLSETDVKLRIEMKVTIRLSLN